jgi:acetyltransferase
MTDISFLMHPKVLAVIGASATKGKVGNAVIRNLANRHTDITVYGVNPKETEIEGFPTVPSILDIPEDVDVAVLTVPASAVLDVADQCGQKGVKGIIVITAGFKEIGGDGLELENQLLEKARQYGMRIVGPNCLGVVSIYHNSTFAGTTPKEGQVAMISQSGAIMTGVSDWSLNNDLGFSEFISLGNKADLDESDFIEYLADDEATKLIVCYLESINHGERFIEVVSKATKNKPVIILKGGVSQAGSRAASSHTGALTGAEVAYDLAFAKGGVIRARTLAELFSYSKTFTVARVPKTGKFAIVTNAGGPGIIATDAYEAEGITIARFQDSTLAACREKLPHEAAVGDPIDIVGDAPPERYDFALRTLFANETEDAVSGVLVILTPQDNTRPLEVADDMIAIHSEYPERVMLASFIGGPGVKEGADKLRDAGIPCYDFPEEAIKNIAGLIKYSRIINKAEETPLTPIKVNKAKVKKVMDGAIAAGRTMLLNYETSAIFQEYGIPSPKTMLAKSQQEARDFAKQIGFPIVMKIVSPQIVHKSDVGGVVLNITTEDEAGKAYDHIMSSVSERAPKAKINGIEVQQMIDTKSKKKSTELILGMAKDPQFGPLIMFGMGGLYANFIKDVAFRLGKFFSVEDSDAIINETKVGTLLKGVRGEMPSDLDGVRNVLQRLAHMIQDFPQIVEMDINPLFAFARGEGVSAVDIKITIKNE